MSGIIFLILRILFALTIYAFLAVAVITIWRELQKTSEVLTIKNIPPIYFKRLDFEETGSKKFTIAVISIGRDTSNEYIIQDETVSSQHARISYHHQQWWIEDLNSTNGTFLNTDPVIVPTVIISGDELRVGKIGIQLTIQI